MDMDITKGFRCYDDKYSKPIQIYKGEDAVYKFMEKMLEEIEWCKKNET